MISRNLLIMLVMMFSLCHAQVAITGGTQKEVDLSQSIQITDWDGLYGQVVLGAGVNVSYMVIGGDLTQVDFIAQEPPQCNGTPEESMHIIAVNASSLVPPLQPGSLSVLDAFMPGRDNGSASFINVSSFNLTYGNFSDIPTLYTFSANSSPGFQEGYFNDADGNLVFVADVVSGKADWNGSISDYQIMLPKSGTSYYIFVDATYSCLSFPPIPPSPIVTFHKLYIQPPTPQPVPMSVGVPIDMDFIVQNLGNFPEGDITVSLQCPAGFSCGSGTIPDILVHDQANTSIPITASIPGEYVLTVCASDGDTSTCRDFLVNVSAQCSVDGSCPSGDFCQSGLCENKKEHNETCGNDGQCLSGICLSGICAYCIGDSDCPDNQVCSAGSCVDVQCQCGNVADHACAHFLCCADSDCGKCQICFGNSCQNKTFDIVLNVIQGQLIEGQPVKLQVLGNDGQGVPGARVFTSESETYADPNGYATIDIPYDGIIYASAECYPNTGLMLTVLKNASFVVPQNIVVGTEISIKIVDYHGLPVSGATIYVDNGAYTTDSNGMLSYTFNTPGQMTISAVKAGYSISGSVLTVNAAGLSCSYPVFFGFLLFGAATIQFLWLLTLALSISNFFLFRRRLWMASQMRFNISTISQLIYAFVPLMIALAPGTSFGICFVSNVVLLQFILELIILALGALKIGVPKPKSGDIAKIGPSN